MGYYIPEAAAEVVRQILSPPSDEGDLIIDKPVAGMTPAALGLDHDDPDYYERFAAP